MQEQRSHRKGATERGSKNTRPMPSSICSSVSSDTVSNKSHAAAYALVAYQTAI